MSEALSEVIADRVAESERRKTARPNYREIPEIKVALENNSKMQAEGEPLAKWFAYEPGKRLELTVEVTDTQLAQIMLGSSFGENPLMPGFKIKGIRFDDLERKDVLVEWLKQQLAALTQPRHD